MARKVSIADEECIGCESCQKICPEVFQIDEATGKAKVIKAEGGPEGLIEEAIATCPVTCIHREE
ncbi:MAG: ferredoxin [Thermodesulfobacteriota bacterium]